MGTTRALSNAYHPDLARVWDRVVPPGGDLLVERMLRHFERRRPGLRGGRALDLCCGTGRSAYRLASSGYRVVGLDLSPAMIARARRHCRRFVADGRVRFSVADVRDFDEGTGFDLAVAPWDGLNHLATIADLKSCFAAVRRSLAPGGMFLFDLVGRESLVHDSIVVERHHDWVAMLEERFVPESGASQTRFSGFVRKRGGLYERYDQTLSWTLFAMADVTNALRAAGFREIHRLDEETLEVELTDPEEAPRVFFTALRPRGRWRIPPTPVPADRPGPGGRARRSGPRAGVRSGAVASAIPAGAGSGALPAQSVVGGGGVRRRVPIHPIPNPATAPRTAATRASS